LKSDNSHAALYWGIPLVAAFVYFGGYGVVRWHGTLKRHLWYKPEAQWYWISGRDCVGGSNPWFRETAISSLELIFRPLCKTEGKFWTWLLSEEDDLSMIPLPSR
jgi:hypothetical protein